MSGYKDLSGLVFGKLSVPKQTPVHNDKGELEWECICECGNKTNVRGYSLRRGMTTSCGCLRGENGRQNWTTHGKSRSIEYNSWLPMIRRCTDTKNQDYASYGGRGIRVCDRWLDSIDNFIDDLGPSPGPGFTVDRINNDGHYEPGNCRWGTREEQSNNRDHVGKHDYGGEDLSIAQIARRENIPYSTLFDRVKRNGMSIEQAISEPIRRRS